MAQNSSNMSASRVNSFRVGAVTERIQYHVSQPSHLFDRVEFSNLCLSLARGIDYAVANKEIPTKASELPNLLKQVSLRCDDLGLKSPIMVLMISVKYACKSGWFLQKDVDDLYKIADEIARVFCSPVPVQIEPSNPPSVISEIMSRFFPGMTMGRVLASLEIVQPGFDAVMADFQILKTTVTAENEKIRLFVARTDKISTSSCIITPPKVNFLINGNAVDKRSNVSMDYGPQPPTNVTSTLKYGTNLLQAIGEFNGCYIITLAFMSRIPSPDIPVLQEYIQPASATLDSDSEIVEGPSRISLRCPLSFKRIKTPAKGHLCKHLQCFDYKNFVDMNSRRPSWRCPNCNQSVCYTDIRIDQKMLKVLKEVGENVTDVIIMADGSWKPILDSNGHAIHLQENNVSHGPGTSDRCESAEDLDFPDELVDLTIYETSKNNEIATYEIEDRKPLPEVLHNCTVNTNPTIPELMNNVSEVAQNGSTQMEDNFWTGYSFQSPSDFPNSYYQHPDTISHALHHQPIVSLSQSQPSTSNNLQVQPYHYDNINPETGRLYIPRNITYAPVAVQALPAQPLIPVSNQRSRISNGFSSASDVNSFSMQHHLPQSWDYHQDLSNMTGHQAYQQQIVGLPAPTQPSNSYRVTPELPQERQHPAQQQRQNPIPQQLQHPAMRPSNFSMSQVQQGTQSATIVQSAALRISEGSRIATPTYPVQHQPARDTVSSLPPSDRPRVPASEPLQRGGTSGGGSGGLPSEQNWRPAGRMRGALSGQAYSAALNQFMMTPSQQGQADLPQPPLGGA